ncbi:MAG TPA: helix-turn-helix domain-containing protein [Solirubrobacterales bacterium]|nr:helix-turn-helix domain-containing protein [Solirubrobacterales bacterium]
MQYLSQRLASKPAREREGAPPAGTLAAQQRERLLDAAEDLIGERGCAGTSIEAIVKVAHVSSVTFYEHFADKEACFVAAFDRAVVETGVELREPGEEGGEADWPGRVRTALAALVATVAARPARARLCLVEAPGGGPALRVRYEATLDVAAAALRQGRLLDSAPRGLPDTVEEAAAGGIAWLLRQQLELDRANEVGELLPELTEIALGPYLDEAEPGARARADDV